MQLQTTIDPIKSSKQKKLLSSIHNSKALLADFTRKHNAFVKPKKEAQLKTSDLSHQHRRFIYNWLIIYSFHDIILADYGPIYRNKLGGHTHKTSPLYLLWLRRIHRHTLIIPDENSGAVVLILAYSLYIWKSFRAIIKS